MLLKVRSAGDPVLRQVARALSSEEVMSTEIQNLILHMRETMQDAPGVGLAAPQIGEPIQMTVIEDTADYHKGISEANLKEMERIPVGFHVMFNPQIELLSPTDISFFEGCLSIPGVMAKVRRSRSVRVSYLDANTNPQVVEANG